MDLAALGSGILETIIYSVLGIVILITGYKILSWVVPFDLNKELSEDDNPAVGIFVAGLFIALGLIIAASIGSPSATTAKKGPAPVKKAAAGVRAPLKIDRALTGKLTVPVKRAKVSLKLKAPVKTAKSGR